MVYKPETSGRSSSSYTESVEDYIEEIYVNYQKGNEGVRITDLAEAMGVTKASATDAVKKLKERGLVKHERYGRIYITEEGLETAKRVYDRHVTITKFLEEALHVSSAVAENDACGIEHIISEETFGQMKKFMKDHPKKSEA
jgi:DtxR family Mn-dependent transcriptional regulator